MADEIVDESLEEGQAQDQVTDKEPEKEVVVDEEAKSHFLDGLFGGQNHREAEKPDDPESETEPETEPETKAQEPEQKEKPKEKPDKDSETIEAAKQPETDLSKLSDAVADGFAKAVDKIQPQQAKEQPQEIVQEDPDSDISQKDKRRIEVLQKMESMNSDYKGIADKYRKSLKAQKEYVSTWKKENPGEEFNAQDNEHDDFYAENNVEWDKEDYDDAVIEVRVDKRMQSTQSKENERLRKLESAERERQLSGQIEQVRTNAIDQAFIGINDEYSFVKDGKIDSELLKQFQDDEPEISEIVIGAVSTADAVALEVMRLWNGLSQFDVSQNEKTGEPNNPVHSFIHSAAIEAEEAILNGDDENKVRDGKKFATNAQLQTMTREEQAKHWGVGTEEIIAASSASFIQDAKEKVKKFEEKMESFAQRRGFAKSDSAKSQNKGTKKSQQEEKKTPVKDPSDPTSVETGNEKAVSKTPGKEPKSGTAKDKFVDRLISGQGFVQQS